jgi:hypothetical protein
MVGLFRTLLIFANVYIIIRFLSRYVFPILLGNFVEKKVSQMNRNMSSGQQTQSHREGEVTLDTTSGNKKKFSKNTGDYVDFEEV